MSETIYAYTMPGDRYPGYVNATREDNGNVRLTVRGDAASKGFGLRPGFTAEITLTEADWLGVVQGVNNEMAERARRGRPVPVHGSGPDNL